MQPNIAFVLEQALGHVAYGLGLRESLKHRTDFEGTWLDVPFDMGAWAKLPLVGRNWTLRGSARAARAIGRTLRQKPLSALFVHTQTISVLASRYMARVPTLLSLDATPMNYDELAHHYGDRVHPSIVEQTKLRIHRHVMSKAVHFTAWSEWAKASLVRDYGVSADRITVIHPGTLLDGFPHAEQRVVRRNGPLRVLFVGGDFKRKGGDLLLSLQQAMPDRIELHLVTGADVTPRQGVFVYRGLKPHSPELLARYREADVFALPTRADCLAVVLGEAMASSLPILTTRVGAHTEAVEDGGSGFLMNVDDAEALRQYFERFYADRDLLERMGRRSRAVAEARFDMRKNANRIADLLLALSRGETAREPSSKAHAVGDPTLLQ